MSSWWLIALGGLLGSSHCVGMCGGFAVMLGLHRRSVWDNLRGQGLYSVGRLTSYATLGGLAGSAGRELGARVPAGWNVPAWLCLAAGVFLIWEGLQALGWWRRGGGTVSSVGCLFGPLMAAWLREGGWWNAWAAGVFTGFLPCGLVYAFVSLAASTGDLLRGMGTMVVFGLGTIPLMVLTGTGAMMLTIPWRQRLWQVAAISVVLTGVLTVGRGVAFWDRSAGLASAECPFCASRETAVPVDVSSVVRATERPLPNPTTPETATPPLAAPCASTSPAVPTSGKAPSTRSGEPVDQP